MGNSFRINIQYNKDFNVHIQSKLLQRTFVVDASSDMGQPFRPRQKGWGRLSRYDIRAEGALPPSINCNSESKKKKKMDYWIYNVFTYEN